jgi:hypothetical protein
MTLERKEKAAQLNKLYAAMANGKALQVFKTDTAKWWDLTDYDGGPNLHSELKWWRIKPEPRRMWQIENGGIKTDSETKAQEWRGLGYAVTEWMEVLP